MVRVGSKMQLRRQHSMDQTAAILVLTWQPLSSADFSLLSKAKEVQTWEACLISLKASCQAQCNTVMTVTQDLQASKETLEVSIRSLRHTAILNAFTTVSSSSHRCRCITTCSDQVATQVSMTCATLCRSSHSTVTSVTSSPLLKARTVL